MNSESGTGPGNWREVAGRNTSKAPPSRGTDGNLPPTPLCTPSEARASTRTHPRAGGHGAGQRGGMKSTVRAPNPALPEAGRSRAGATPPPSREPAGGGPERGRGKNGRRGRRGPFRRAGPAPGRPRACNRGLAASGGAEGRGGTAGRTKRLRKRAPARPARPPPKRSPPGLGPARPSPPRAAGSRARTRSSRAAARSARSRPARRSGEKGRATAARGPTHHDPRPRPGRAGGDALSRVASVPLPRAPEGPLRYYSHAHARRAHARAPRPLGLAPLRARGRFGRPPPPLAGASPAVSRGGRRGRGGAGEEAARAASRAPSWEHGLSRAAAAPPAGRAAICRPSGLPPRGGSRLAELGGEPVWTHLLPASVGCPWMLRQLRELWEGGVYRGPGPLS